MMIIVQKKFRYEWTRMIMTDRGLSIDESEWSW